MTYISTLEGGTDERYHRSPIIIHRDMWYFAEFQTMDQLEIFARTFGFTYELKEERKWLNTEKIYREYTMSHQIIDSFGGGFWKLSELPADAKPFKGLSNGSIVTCYFTNDGETIRIYRPNPNAKEIYKPLELDEHIAHRKTYGLY